MAKGTEKGSLGRVPGEPDWSSVSDADLLTAERYAKHRYSGGEQIWEDVLLRIRKVMKSRKKGSK